jgi:large subunit ribosomal protein L10
MPTQTKIDEVARLKEKLESAISLVLADYRGLTANEMVELREKFTKQGLEYRVVKDTLARLAADAAGIEGLADLFEGPISIAFGYEDPAIAFKLSEECRKTYAPRYELKGGVFEGVLVPEGEVVRYAALPSREELLAKLAMLLSSPMRAMAVLLKAKIRELAVLLGEVAKKREQEPDRPAAAEASEEPEPEAQENAEQPEDQPEEESQEPPEEQEEKQEEEE